MNKILMNFKISNQLKQQFQDACKTRSTTMSYELINFINDFVSRTNGDSDDGGLDNAKLLKLTTGGSKCNDGGLDNVKLLKLTTGEELVAEVQEELSKELLIKDIAILVPTERGVGLMPYMPYADLEDGVYLSVASIVFSADPVEGLINQYKSMFNKIMTPSSKIVI